MESAFTQLDSKRSVEDYLLKKVNQVLDNTFGPGAAIANVDVQLNHDQDRTTTEDVLPAKGQPNGTPTGVLVRERQSNHGPSVAPAPNATSAVVNSSENSSVESDYQVGRRVQQTVTAPGSVRRMTIAVVVKKSLDAAQLEQVKEVVALSVGLNLQRGDAIVIQSMDKLLSAAIGLQLTPSSQLANATTTAASKVAANGAASVGAASEVASQAARPNQPKSADDAILRWILLLLIVLPVLLVLIWWLGQRRQPKANLSPAMNQAERDQLLQEVQQWIQQGVLDDAIRSRK